jgi:hypothetical protein
VGFGVGVDTVGGFVWAIVVRVFLLEHEDARVRVFLQRRRFSAGHRGRDPSMMWGRPSSLSVADHDHGLAKRSRLG